VPSMHTEKGGKGVKGQITEGSNGRGFRRDVKEAQGRDGIFYIEKREKRGKNGESSSTSVRKKERTTRQHH